MDWFQNFLNENLIISIIKQYELRTSFAQFNSKQVLIIKNIKASKLTECPNNMFMNQNYVVMCKCECHAVSHS
jgi:hypothetical protein